MQYKLYFSQNIMKKIWLLSLILLANTMIFLTGCETNTNNPEISSNNTWDNENPIIAINNDPALETIKWLTKLLNKSESDIIQENIRWLDHTNIYGENNEIPGFSVATSWIAYNNVPNLDKSFDGWHLEYVWDWILSSIIEYKKDWVVCYIHSFPEKEVPYELMNREWDYDDDEYDKTWDEFMQNLTYEITYECANLPEEAINYEDIYFDIFQEQWMQQTNWWCYAENWVTVCKDPLMPEPFWSASIRWNHLAISNEYGINWRYYFSEFSKDWDSVTFEWYDNITTITKQECTDYAWWKHDYSVRLIIEGDMVYEWCAEKNDMWWLIIWEQGFLSTFNKKTRLNIIWWEDTRYEVIEMLWNYVQVSIDNYINEEFISNQMLLERESDGWEILYQWDYTADLNTCEKINQYDMNLMEMSLFYNCPRG